MHRIIRISTLLLVGLLAGCASYQEAETLGKQGYFTRFIGGSRAQIVYTGNQFTSKQRVRDLAYLRAAELALEQGHSHFIITNEDIVVRTLNGSFSGSYGATRRLPGPITPLQPGQSYQSYQQANSIKMPNTPAGTPQFDYNVAQLEVFFLTPSPSSGATAGKAIEAASLVKTLKAKYGL